jgi:hypothetical protein
VESIVRAAPRNSEETSRNHVRRCEIGRHAKTQKECSCDLERRGVAVARHQAQVGQTRGSSAKARKGETKKIGESKRAIEIRNEAKYYDLNWRRKQ